MKRRHVFGQNIMTLFGGLKLSPATLVVWVALMFLVPSVASSQSTDEPQNPPAPPADAAKPQPEGQTAPGRHMTTTWGGDGLVIQSDDGEYWFRLGAFMRFDGRFAVNDLQHVDTDAFLIRTLRMAFQGQLGKYITFRLVPDFTGNGASTVADAYVDLRFSNALHLQVGRDKVPVGFEVLLQDSNVVLMERGVTVNLLPFRDVGIQLYGDLPGGVVSYAAGVFNGQVDGASNGANTPEADNAKDLVGRLVVRPFRSRTARALEHLSLAIGGSRGQERDAGLPFFRTSVQQVYFSYAEDAMSDGLRTRVSPQVSYYFHSFGAYAEYVRSRQRVSRETTHADVTNRAWQVVGSVILTGETAGERIRPKEAFDPEQRKWGALQLTARYGMLSVDPTVFTLGLADANASRQAQVATVGANWFLTNNLKAMLNVERSVFDRDSHGSRDAEHAILFRLQLNY